MLMLSLARRMNVELTFELHELVNTKASQKRENEFKASQKRVKASQKQLKRESKTTRRD